MVLFEHSRETKMPKMIREQQVSFFIVRSSMMCWFVALNADIDISAYFGQIYFIRWS